MIALLLAQIIDVAARDGHVAVARQDGVVLDEKSVKTTVSQVAGIVFGPDGELLVFGGKPGRTGELERAGEWRMADHEDMIHAVACCKTWLATASHDKTVVVRRRDGTVHRKLEGHTGGVLAVAFTSDGGLLASAGEDRTIRLWEPENGRLIRTIVNHGDRVGALAWSPDGKVLASGSRDRTVRIWQPDIGRLVRIVRGHEGEVTDLTWDDLGLATACSDGKVRLIDGGSDAILRTLDAGTWTGSVALTPAEILAGAAELVRWKR